MNTDIAICTTAPDIRCSHCQRNPSNIASVSPIVAHIMPRIDRLSGECPNRVEPAAWSTTNTAPFVGPVAASPAAPMSGFKVDMSLVEKWQRENNVVQEPGSCEAAMVIIRHDENGMPTVWCDPEIADIVRALNDAGITTVASCSGHGLKPGIITLSDGRELIVCESREQAHQFHAALAQQAEHPPSKR